MKSQQSGPFLSRLAVFLLLLSIGTATALSQDKLKFRIADFYQDQQDISAISANYAKIDGNGDKYAIIKVSSNNPQDKLSEYQFNFGNMSHTVVEHDDELWLYVQKNAKRVTISRKGYVTISKFDLQTTIESGKNYVMKLTSEDKKVLTQMVQFTIMPADINAIVSVANTYANDGQEEVIGTADATGSVAKNLEYGTYTYKVMAPNYHTSGGSFTLNNSKETHIENIELRPNFSIMTFTVDANADIYINGEKKGTRQWSGVLKSGNYQVECRQANHKSSSQYIQVVENDNRTIQLVAPEPILGTVSITSNPLGANIDIDNTPYGQTPILLDLILGRHKVVFSKDGYTTETQDFEVNAVKTTTISATLGRKASMDIKTKPSASLYIDNIFKGYTPITIDGEAGYHQVTLQCKGYSTISKKIYFGNEKSIAFSLKKQYIKHKDLYIEVGGSAGSIFGATAALGVHVANFNIEANYNYNLTPSTSIYWVKPNVGESGTNYKPLYVIGGKIGYRIITGTRFSITPQIGYRFTKLSGHIFRNVSFNDESYPPGDCVTSPYCSSATFGLRSYLAICKWFGISLTPEYFVAVVQGDGFKRISEASSKIKQFGTGFNAKLTLVVTI